MINERGLMDKAQRDLSSAGYPLVLAGMPLTLRDRRYELDAVGFTSDKSGSLRPYVVIEVKGSARFDEQGLLDRFALIRDVLGTRHHYVLAGDRWLAADPGLRGFAHVDSLPFPERTDGVLQDRGLLSVILRARLWALSEQLRGGEAHPTLAAVRQLIADLTASGHGRLPLGGDQVVSVDPLLVWQVVRDEIRHFLVRAPHFEEFLSPPSLAGPLVRLLGDTVPSSVTDPFAGLGSFLWAAADRTSAHGGVVELSGMDVNASLVELGSAIAQLCPFPFRLELGNSFTAEVAPVDAVISQPPAGLRLPEPRLLASGDATRDGDLAAIDVCLSQLRPGGRAVLHLSRGWTFRGGEAARYRAYLAQNWRVAALIGLPSGAFSGTAIPSVVLVVDRAAPGETFVAQLEANWAAELDEDSDVLRACLAHLRGGPSDMSVGAQLDASEGDEESR
ncbi:HsdM family class I SAM-dependent methyltransferase [Geodermatophilus sp. SYSU D01176]